MNTDYRDMLASELRAIRNYLNDLADSHDICYEENSDGCQYDTIRQAAELLDEVIVYRVGYELDGATARKQDLEDALIDEVISRGRA